MKTPDFTSRMVGFMLAYEQFPVPESVDLGGLAEQAGFDLIPIRDHFHLGRRTMGPNRDLSKPSLQPCSRGRRLASLNLLSPGRIFLGITGQDGIRKEASGGRVADGLKPTSPESHLWEANRLGSRNLTCTSDANESGRGPPLPSAQVTRPASPSSCVLPILAVPHPRRESPHTRDVRTDLG